MPPTPPQNEPRATRAGNTCETQAKHVRARDRNRTRTSAGARDTYERGSEHAIRDGLAGQSPHVTGSVLLTENRTVARETGATEAPPFPQCQGNPHAGGRRIRLHVCMFYSCFLLHMHVEI